MAKNSMKLPGGKKKHIHKAHGTLNISKEVRRRRTRNKFKKQTELFKFSQLKHLCCFVLRVHIFLIFYCWAKPHKVICYSF